MRVKSAARRRPRKGGARAPYHLVDLRGNGYRGGYLDTDVRMLLACFKLFEEFYETEYPGPVEWARADAREIEALYAWWKHGRRRVQEEASRLSRTARVVLKEIPRGLPGGVLKWSMEWRSPSAKRKWMAAWKKECAQDQQMLLRLMAIRERLWT